MNQTHHTSQTMRVKADKSPLQASSVAQRIRVQVWDFPTRLFHWLLALGFLGAWLSSESERWQLFHISFGYTLMGLVVFRLVWGVVGTRYARFSNFVRGPRAVLDYTKSLLPGNGDAEHFTGHNPLGGVAVILLLGGVLLTAATGWAAYSDFGGNFFENIFEESHELLSHAMLFLIAGHLVGVLLSSVLHKENLVRAMFTGSKVRDVEQNKPSEALYPIRRNHPILALFMLFSVALFWAYQFGFLESWFSR